MLDRKYATLFATSAAIAALLFAGCGGGGGGSSTVPGTGTVGVAPPTATPSPASISSAIAAATGGSLILKTVHCGTYTFTIAPNALSADTTVTIQEVYQSSLSAPLSIGRHPQFTAGAGNTYVCGFNLDLGSATLSSAMSLSASSASTNAPDGTIFNIAYFANSTWNDIGSAMVDAQGGFSTTIPSAALPGIVKAGQYLIYGPAAGDTVVANFGLAIFGNDTNAVQVVHLYDQSGNLLPTPTLTLIPYLNNSDLDGLAVTPSGSMGVVTDGGKMLYFFTGTNTGNPVASSESLDLSAYGSDGDAVAILPNGDEAVVSLDSNNSLVLVSGILSGQPKPAETIPLPGNREALVMSNDGKVLLARSGPNLTVFNVTPVTPSAGPLGGTVSHAFTQTADMSIPDKSSDDAHEGMAFSPIDSSRAVVVGVGPAADLITGLPSAPVVQSAAIRAPAFTGVHRFDTREREPHPMTAISGGDAAYSVTISPDGKYAYIAMDKGIAVFSGVDTGTLTQTQMYTVPLGSSDTLWEIESVGITLDGKYLVALGLSTNTGAAYLVVMPISDGTIGAPIGSPTSITLPYIDGLIMH